MINFSSCYYYLDKKLVGKELEKQIGRIALFYPKYSITFLIEDYNQLEGCDYLSNDNNTFFYRYQSPDFSINASIVCLEDDRFHFLRDFPTNLRRREDNNKILFIFDTTYQLAGGKSKNKDILKSRFIENYMDLFSRGIYFAFYRFPYLDSENIELYVQNISGYNSYSLSAFDTVLNINYDIFADNAEAESKAKSFLVKTSGKTVGNQNEEYRTEKSVHSKDFILTNIKKLTDKQMIAELGISKRTYYKYKQELEEEGLLSNN